MRRRDHLLLHALSNILLTMSAHIAKMPAAIVHTDTNFLPLGKPQLAEH